MDGPSSTGQPQADAPRRLSLRRDRASRADSLARRVWFTLAFFIELVVLGALLSILALGGLPENPSVLIWCGGMVVALSAALAVGLPGAWTQRALLHGALIGGSVLFMLPFLWLISTSFKYPEETFVYPPQWLPQLPDAVKRSPYVIEVDRPDPPPPIAQALWEAARPYISTAQLERVDADAAARSLARWLWADLSGGQADAAVAPLRPLSAEQVNEAWTAVYRGVAVGRISVQDERRRTMVLPADSVRWSQSGPVRTASDSDDLLVDYDLNDEPAFELAARIDPAALPESPAVVSVALRQDRSWHRVRLRVARADGVWETVDPLYLGARGWVEWGLKLPGGDDRDERGIGVWPLRPVAGATGTADGSMELTLRVERSSPWGAAWAKFTAAYRGAWYADEHWLRYLLNSTLLVVLNVAGQLLSCSMVAYAFARLRWPGRDLLFGVLLATMMLPGMVTMIPVFLIFKRLGWYNTLLPLWAPAFFGSAFFIFMLRQFMKAVPRELEEAALIDGCSWFGIYWRIMLPLMKPALAAVAIFTFMGVWNEFMGPLIYLSDQRNYPLSLGLFNFRSQFGGDFGMLMAASTMLTLPVIALFFIAQRYFIQGVTLTGIKG